MPDAAENLLKPVLTREAWELLNSLPAYDQKTAQETNLTLRKQGWDPQTVAAVLTQLRLRRDARPKFGNFAGQLLLTQHGLEQATRLQVAARHAHRFRDAGVSHVVDMGCGLGADSLAFASAGLQVTALEADETTAAAALMNLRPFPEAQVIHTTAEQWAADHLLAEGISGTGVWLDPARRTEQSRLWDPEEFSPPLSFVTELAATGVPLGVKLGPGIPHELIPSECEAEWVSVNGELVEVTLWFNGLARHGVRRAATVLSTPPGNPPQAGSPAQETSPSTAVELSSAADFGQSITVSAAGPGGLHGVLWEPDPAVIRSGLVAELCEQVGGRLLDERIAYFCSDEDPDPTPSPLARRFRVVEVIPFSAKRLKQWCAAQQVTSVDIKKRGVDVVPELLRQQILPKKPKGSPTHITLVITRLGSTRLAAVVEPLD
ncbi:SAM-dependent methyltransferase [Nesterenkonia salmonea]|uniref:SAM-dependent methyltransferase n=1 Tax=Nesterenkonia salmonea TaxID=1804987 RepID=A0A5R9B7P4_9MICC|nr:SAM-dependent methyltransferase [Nesterenkonia salmonea]TLP93431.1 SAM-dependent methyltransferase [Nesterenkonia salmonea]